MIQLSTAGQEREVELFWDGFEVGWTAAGAVRVAGGVSLNLILRCLACMHGLVFAVRFSVSRILGLGCHADGLAKAWRRQWTQFVSVKAGNLLAYVNIA